MQEYALEVMIRDKPALAAAYMPFINNGGLFIAARDNFQMGEVVSFSLKLWCLAESLSLLGKVIWLTPQQAQGGRPAGIGLQFIQENAKAIKDLIEKQLAGFLPAEQSTDTL